MIERRIKENILKSMIPNKVNIILGPRRVGKTVLLKEIIRESENYLFLNGEDFSVQDLLKNRTINNYQSILMDKDILFIDEAQMIPEIGKILKLIVDGIEGVKIVITGSSAFNISSGTGEPLTGRSKTHILLPFSEKEILSFEDILYRKENLNNRLVYGNYPEVYLLKKYEDKAQYLNELVKSYLLKDILAFENVKNSDRMFKLLRLIAFQIGKEVSVQELAQQLQISRATVDKYLDLLEKVFVIYKIGGYAKNLRKEVVKNSKYYFFDNGIRNAIIANFNSIDLRDDVGLLWENYIISERIKYNYYNNNIVNYFYWRTYDHQEIDFLEEKGGALSAYEMKWKSGKIKEPGAFSKAYPEAKYQIINSTNYLDFVV